MDEPTTTGHTIQRTWIRREAGAVPEEQTRLTLIAGEGVVDDHARGRKRHVTLVFEDDWNAAARDLGVEVDPVGRRANVLQRPNGVLHVLDAQSAAIST